MGGKASKSHWTLSAVHDDLVRHARAAQPRCAVARPWRRGAVARLVRQRHVVIVHEQEKVPLGGAGPLSRPRRGVAEAVGGCAVRFQVRFQVLFGCVFRG